jgi:carboxypeptidase C (cathepsin A)
LVDNEYSVLDITDLVFIDPVSTGYSRAVPGEKPEEFHNFKKDIESVGDFIRLYTTRYRRWTSPKFLIGESYGTTRASGLAGYLQKEHGFYLNGIMLVSIVLNFQTIRFGTGNDLPHILFLPTFAAAAWHHQRLSKALQSYSLEQLLAEVADFAMGDYALALMKGSTLSAEEKQQITEKLAAYTGLSEDYISRTNLRINIHRFTKELLRDQRRTIGRFDSRYSGLDRDAAGEFSEFDPSDTEINGAFTASLQDYLSSELEYESEVPYRILAHLWESWRYDEHQNQYVDVAETLRKAMSINPHLKVFVANGYYDLATPFMAAEYTINHLQLEPELYDNVVMAYYEAGHMMYLHRPSLKKLKQDLADFLLSAVSAH